jgi:hypothetical protein
MTKSYYSKRNYSLQGFEKSTAKGKMYNALLKNKKTKRIIRVPFGSTTYENYKDTTGLNLYPQLIHGDKQRRKQFISRMLGFVKEGYYSPGFFSMHYLWK